MLPEFIKYYYHKLSDVQKGVYMQMYDGFKVHRKAIDIAVDTSIVSMEDLMYIFRCLYNDTPSFYFLQVSGIYRILKTQTGYILSINYQYSESDIAYFDDCLTKGLAAFKARYITQGMTDYEKELVIHDYLVKTVSYDYRTLESDALIEKHGEIFNVLGPLLRKKGVCWGIACAFKLLCDYCHVKCLVAIGKARYSQNDNEGHAWNIVRLEDESYHVDVTWDIKKKGDISCVYDNLNLSDSLIRLDHTWDDTIYPPCNSLKYNYFRKYGLYVNDIQLVPEYVKTKVAAGSTYITFKFVNKALSVDQMRDAVAKGVARGRYHKPYSLAINPVTHNVYIELSQNKKRVGLLESLFRAGGKDAADG